MAPDGSPGMKIHKYDYGNIGYATVNAAPPESKEDPIRAERIYAPPPYAHTLTE